MNNDNFGDWRIEAVTTIVQDVPAAYPGGPSHRAGTPVYKASVTKHAEYNTIGFVTPSPIALALNTAARNAFLAQELRRELILRDVVTPWGAGKSVANENLPHLYDFFESCMIAVISSFQSLEMFSNVEISRHPERKFQLKRKRAGLILSAGDLERKGSTDEKIGDILPELLGIQSPRGNALWEEYLELKKARDATVHLKARDMYTGKDIDSESLFFQFFQRDASEHPRTAFKIIEYFHRGRELPRWCMAAKLLLAK